MKSSTFFTSLAAASLASAAGRPSDESICDYYTTALLKQNTAANQQTLLTLVVNTAVIGNYTMPNVGIAVPGILAPGMFKGTKVNLLPYFDGMLKSSNNGGSMGVSMNFLDGGGAAPLKKNMPANDKTSNQYMLLIHLYEYFAVLLGCSMFGSKVMPYGGDTSMTNVHKFMDLDAAEFGYFVTQVGLSAASFGVAESDVVAVGEALGAAFGMRCAPPAAIPSTAQPALQAICLADDCEESANATCSSYPKEMMPASASASMSPTGSSSMMPSGSAAPSVPPSNKGATILPILSTLGAFALGVALFLL